MAPQSRRLLWRAALAGAVAAGVLAGSNAATSDTTDWIMNPTFAKNVEGWKVSDQGRLERVVTNEYTAGRITSRDGRRTVHMTSDISDAAMTEGSTLAVRVRIQTPRTTVKVGVEAREVDADGDVIAKRSWSSSRETTKWRWVDLKLTTMNAGDHFSLRVIGYSLRGSKSVKVREASVAVTAPSPSPTTTPTPTPTQSPSPSDAPTTTTPPVAGPTFGSADTRPCTSTQLEQLDYGRAGNLAWSDEFEGTSVDTSRWRVRNETTLSFDQARIMARNVAVNDGLLSITARRETVSGRDYTTGYLDTIGKFSRKYGRWEMRAKLPTAPDISRGLWPAFWLRADQQYGEIDVMEAWGDPSSRDDTPLTTSYSWTLHENTNSPSGSQRYGGWGRLNVPIADAFHVWAVDWAPDCLEFTMDGATTGSVATASAPWLVSALSGPVNIRLNMQVGSSYWGFADASKPEETRLPATYLIDYVRVYQPVD